MKNVITSVFALAISRLDRTRSRHSSRKSPKDRKKKDYFDFSHVPNTVLTIALLGDSWVSGKKLYAS